MSGIHVSSNAVELRPVAGTQSSAARDLIDAERGAAVAAVDIVRTFRGRTALDGASLEAKSTPYSGRMARARPRCGSSAA